MELNPQHRNLAGGFYEPELISDLQALSIPVVAAKQ